MSYRKLKRWLDAGKLASSAKQVCNIAFEQSAVKNKPFWGAKNQQVC